MIRSRHERGRGICAGPQTPGRRRRAGRLRPARIPRRAPRAGRARSAPGLRRPLAEKHRSWLVAAVARGFALFVGAFTLVNVVRVVARTTPTSTSGGSPCRRRLGTRRPARARRRRARRLRRGAADAPVAALADRRARRARFAAVTAWNGVDFYLAWRDGEFEPGVPFPLSFVVCAVLVFVGWAALRRRRRGAGGWAAAAVRVARRRMRPAVPGRTGLLLRRDRLPAVLPTSSSSSAPRCTRTARRRPRCATGWTPPCSSTRTAPCEAHRRLRRGGRQRLQRGAVMRDMAVEAGRPRGRPWSSTRTA